MSRLAKIEVVKSGEFKFFGVNGFVGSNFLGWFKFPYGLFLGLMDLWVNGFVSVMVFPIVSC